MNGWNFAERDHFKHFELHKHLSFWVTLGCMKVRLTEVAEVCSMKTSESINN